MPSVVPAVSPYNDLVFIAKLYEVNPDTGLKSPLDSAYAVEAFLTNTIDPTAGPPDASLVVNVDYIAAEKWLVSFDGGDLTPAALDTLFGTGTPYLVVQTVGDRSIRVGAKLAYVRSKLANVT